MIDYGELSQEFLKEIWKLNGNYSLSEQQFFKSLLIDMYLLCESIKWDKSTNRNIKLLVVPSLLSTEIGLRTEMNVSNTPENVRWFVIDFVGSRRYPNVSDIQKKLVPFLPVGLFERLQCILGLHGATFSGRKKFLVESNKVEVSFGKFVALRAQLVYEKQLNNKVLKFYLAPWMSKEQCEYTAQIIYSILEKIKLSFFNKSKGKTILAASLLFPSSTRSGEHLADSDYLQQCLKDREEFIYPDPMTDFTRVPLNEYTTWLNKSAQPMAKIENKKNRESPRLKRQRQSPIEEYFQFLRSIPLPRFLRINAYMKKEQNVF